MDTYQGKMKTISPAIGPYDINTYINLDIDPPNASGVTGSDTLQPVKWEQGYTGINGSNFTNSNHGF